MKYIYVAKFSKHPDLVKIGCSEKPDRRAYVLSFTHGSLIDIESMEVGENGFDIEDYLHWYFKDQKVVTSGDGSGEFFRIDTNFDDSVKIIMEAMKTFGNKESVSRSFRKILCDLLLEVIEHLDGGISSTDKLVLITLLSYMAEGSLHTRPLSFSEMSKSSLLSKRTLSSTIDRLEGAGIISRDKTNHCSANYYVFNMDKIEDMCRKG